MNEVKDISIKEYFLMQDVSEYDVFIDIMEPKNLFCGNKFHVDKITFDEFNTILYIFNNPNPQNLKDLFVHLWRVKGDMQRSAESIFLQESIFSFFSAKNFLMKFVKRQLELESKLLYSEPDSKMIELGVSERLKNHRSMLTKIALGKQFGIDPYEVGEWKYSKVLNILATNNALEQIQKEYAKK